MLRKPGYYFIKINHCEPKTMGLYATYMDCKDSKNKEDYFWQIMGSEEVCTEDELTVLEFIHDV